MERFRKDAKSIVDLMFDSKVFKEQLTRNDIQTFEDFVQFLLDSAFTTREKIKQFEDKYGK